MGRSCRPCRPVPCAHLNGINSPATAAHTLTVGVPMSFGGVIFKRDPITRTILTGIGETYYDATVALANGRARSLLDRPSLRISSAPR